MIFMDDGRKWFYWFLFIVALLLIGSVFKILPIIGAGIVVIGLIIFLYGASNNNEEDAVWGAIIIVVGFIVLFAGIVLYNFLENVGVINFLKLIFGSGKSLSP